MDADPVAAHYTRGDLHARVLDALVAAGHDPDDLGPEALAPAEEFHTFGRLATVALADAAGLRAGESVLDVGSGLGGPARHLAREYGVSVTGIDLTAELCEVAADLTRRVGLDDRVTIEQGDALALPYPDGRFDVVWTQHVSMNIADKAGLFGEMRRVVADGGRLAFFDILGGEVAPLHFPVPWAEDQSVSFLATPDETRAHLAEAGFAVQVWDDVTADAAAFFDALAAGPPPDATPLGLHLLIPNMPEKGANLARNLREGRIALVRSVADAV